MKDTTPLEVAASLQGKEISMSGRREGGRERGGKEGGREGRREGGRGWEDI